MQKSFSPFCMVPNPRISTHFAGNVNVFSFDNALFNFFDSGLSRGFLVVTVGHGLTKNNIARITVSRTRKCIVMIAILPAERPCPWRDIAGRCWTSPLAFSPANLYRTRPVNKTSVIKTELLTRLTTVGRRSRIAAVISNVPYHSQNLTITDFTAVFSKW